MDAALFSCSICGEGSREICVYCTKDACMNHLCERCHRCSDCCTCEMPLTRREQTNSTPEVIASNIAPELVHNGAGKLAQE